MKPMTERLQIDVEMWQNSNGFASCDESECFCTVYRLAQEFMRTVDIDPEMDAAISEELEFQAEAKLIAFLETGIKGANGIYPDWVYKARNAIKHQNEQIPWLPDLLKILGWQGGTVRQALNAVSRLVEQDKKMAIIYLTHHAPLPIMKVSKDGEHETLLYADAGKLVSHHRRLVSLILWRERFVRNGERN